MKVLPARGHLLLVGVLALIVGSTAVHAEWDIENGQWGKDDPTDIRVMTWNIHDGICKTEVKQEGSNQWTAIARIVAALKPDFLLLQEAGDSTDGGDTMQELEIVCDLFLHGGTDPFVGGNPEVTAYVQAYDPNYDLPYIFVSGESDGYNRNVILSRFPFMDLNGDTRSVKSDIPAVLPHLYAPGGDGKIRGFMMAEVDLDDDIYAGDLVVGNCHLRAYSDGAAERLAAAQNVAYVIDYWFNGGGFGVPDYYNKIADSPLAQWILDDNTPIVFGGDFNEDEQTNGRRGPADWFTQAEYTGGSDGTDRDRTDMVFDSALHPVSGNRGTYSASNKLDYLAWQDSIVALRRAFIFYSNETPLSYLPPEVLDFLPTPLGINSFASDHRPVIVDLILPTDPCAGYVLGDSNGDSDVNAYDIDWFIMAVGDSANYIAQFGEQAWLCRNDINDDDDVNAYDIDGFILVVGGGG
ncbi:MAG: endonuclease/exonuclease/phosphatase family protein [Planctomycetota bacterium]